MNKKFELSQEQIVQIFAAGYRRGCDATESGTQDQPETEAAKWLESDAAEVLKQV